MHCNSFVAFTPSWDSKRGLGRTMLYSWHQYLMFVCFVQSDNCGVGGERPRTVTPLHLSQLFLQNKLKSCVSRVLNRKHRWLTQNVRRLTWFSLWLGVIFHFPLAADSSGSDPRLLWVLADALMFVPSDGADVWQDLIGDSPAASSEPWNNTGTIYVLYVELALSVRGWKPRLRFISFCRLPGWTKSCESFGSDKSCGNDAAWHRLPSLFMGTFVWRENGRVNSECFSSYLLAVVSGRQQWFYRPRRWFDLRSPSVSCSERNNRRSSASPPIFTSQDTQLCVFSYIIQARVH